MNTNWKFKTVPKKLLFTVCLFCLLAGCAPSLAHLDSNPLSFDEEEQLSMRHWKFEYINTSDNDDFLLEGKARLLYENMPVTRDWIHSLRLSAYLSDDQGAVLARDSQNYPSMRMRHETEVPFSFRLDPGQIPVATDIYITFGYSMNLTDHRFFDGRHERPLTGKRDTYRIRKGPLAR